jgi:hypothetical protein
MIPLNEAIETGAWFEVESKYQFDDDRILKYRLKLNGFSKVNLEAIDNPEELHIPINSNIWVLEFDFINSSKEQISWVNILSRINLIDDEGYKYEVFLDDGYLLYMSDFSKNLGYERDMNKKYPPKIRKSGAVFFELPEEIYKLFIAFEYGEISEV